jgi:peptidoglycan-associated lipoprotein
VVIDRGIGTVLPENCITVVPAEDTTWQAVAKGCGGEARESITLSVKVETPAQPPAPRAEPWTLEDVFFEYDWYRLTPEAIKTLDENIRKLKEHPETRVTLEATCDERGAMIYNKYLSIARAESVREYLVEHGIEPSKLEVQPQGETTKWDSRLNDQGWALNRRVHFILIPR